MLLDGSEIPPTLDTPQRTRRGGLRWIFSFPVVLSALLVVLTVVTVRGRFTDPDLWWHLKTGEMIWNSHEIPTADSFSFTTNHHAYIPHEWLSQTVIYAAYHAGGYRGLMFWFCVATSLLVVAGYALSSVYSGNLKVAFLGGLITWLFATVGLSIRPQIIGYLFLVALLLLIHLGQSRDRRWFLVLPPMFAIWVNCHGSFFLGLIVLGATMICSFAELQWGQIVSRRWTKDRRKTFAVAFILSIAALFVNPIGWKQVTYPLDTLLNQKLQMTVVSEWQPPNFSDARSVAMVAIAGLILLVPLLRRAELTLQDLLYLALAFGLAAQHIRMLFVFGIFAAPVLCRLLADCWDQYEPDRDRPVANAVILAVLVGMAIWFFPNRRELLQQVEKSNPVKAVDFINRAGLSGNMFNDYVFGGYLIWAAPQHKVFVDGRGDVFEWTGVLEEYEKWIGLQVDPTLLLSKYKIRFCILAANTPMARVLALLPGWTKVYSDEFATVWTRSDNE